MLNTDSQALAQCPLPHKFNLGLKLNGGLGAGGDPERGRAAAEEDEARLRELCQGVDMVFICAGLGGGTGTGAGPVLARVAKECGALALAFVTLPFDCEGPKRMRQARQGLEEFKAAADGVICLPNQKVFGLIDEHTSVIETFATTNDLLAQSRAWADRFGRTYAVPPHLPAETLADALLATIHHESAVFVPEPDSRLLAAAVVEVFADQDRARSIGAAARTAAASFRVERTAATLLDELGRAARTARFRGNPGRGTSLAPSSNLDVEDHDPQSRRPVVGTRTDGSPTGRAPSRIVQGVVPPRTDPVEPWP